MIRTYDSGYRGECRSERTEQIDCMGWLEKHYPDRWPLIWHTPGETKATISHRVMRKKEGVKPGIADIVDFGEVRGAFELKRLDRTKSATSANQKAFLIAVDDSGGFAAICYGFEGFKLAYLEYIAYIIASRGGTVS